MKLGLFRSKIVYRSLTVVFLFLVSLMTVRTASVRNQMLLAERNMMYFERARAAERRARTTADSLLGPAAKEDTHPAKVDPVERRLLQEALGYYERLLNPAAPGGLGKLRKDDAFLDIRQETADAYRRLGAIQQRLGRFDKAEEAYRQALTFMQMLVTSHPKNAEYHRDLAGDHDRLGAALEAAGRRKEADQHHAQAAAIRQKLAADFPGYLEKRPIPDGGKKRTGSNPDGTP